MGSTYGKSLKLTIFGQSHSSAIGMTMEGIPAGIEIDFDKLERFMQRRAPGNNPYSTPRKEADKPEFLSGLVGNVTCGVPLTAIIRNTNIRPEDYDELKNIPRPGHADLTGQIRYGGFQDASGGGHFSGRMTAPLCIAGGIAKQILEKEGITVISRIFSIAGIKDNGELLEDISEKEFPVIDDEAGKRMIEKIISAKEEGDSVGGIIECKVLGVPAGIGDPIFDGMENRISSAIFGIPAIKGIEFGNGFECASLKGSENNDAWCIKDERIITRTNNCGGILGGITNGMPLTFKVAVKPTASISKEQDSVDLNIMENAKLSVVGRHDPCIVQRAVPCVEAAAAIAVYDAILSWY